MYTRIRELRKLKGWTLQQVANLVGTTAQTVQRLETDNMTVSMDWLERFAKVFSVPPSSLIRDQSRSDIPFLGTMNDNGLLRSPRADESIEISTVADQPVAIKLLESLGSYRAGSFLIGNRLEREEMIDAHGFDSIVSLDENSVLLSKVICQDSTFTLAPISRTLPIRFDALPNWVAPILMEVRYF